MDISTGNIKLSNVIGAPFRDYVLLQLYMRAANGGTKNRTNEQVLYLANKTAWVRLTSSVNITLPAAEIQDYYKKLGVTIAETKEDSLARNWILEAGTSTQTGDGNGISLREGFGINGAYGLGGTEELGYRPMPGLTAVNIETTGRLGSLRLATINFKVWNMHQLNAVEALYFRLGYSMILEWGHTQYYNNDGTFAQSEIYGIPNPFTIADVEGGKRKEYIQQEIAKKARLSSGNYDGMMGVVSHFNWSMNQEGGYDCSVKLVGLGSIIDSVRINQAYKIPGKLVAAFKSDRSAVDDYLEKLRRKNKALQDQADYDARVKAEQDKIPKSNLPAAPADSNTLWKLAVSYNKYPGDINQFIIDSSFAVWYRPSSLGRGGAYNGVGYYVPFGNYADIDANINKEVIAKYGGVWFESNSQLGWQRLPLLDTTQVVLNTATLNAFAAANPPTFFNTADGTTVADTTAYTGANAITQRLDKGFGTLNNATGRGQVNTRIGVDEELQYISNATQRTISYGISEAATISTRLKPNRSTGVPPGSSDNLQEVYFIASAQVVNAGTSPAKYYQPTRRAVLAAIDSWLAYPNLGNLEVKYPQKGVIVLTGTVLLTVPSSWNNHQPALSAADKKIIEDQYGTTFNSTVKLTITTNNLGFIKEIRVPDPNPGLTAALASKPNSGDADLNVNQADQKQYESSLGYASALHAMLVVVEAKAQKKALGGVGVITVPIKDTTIEFYNDGVLRGLLTDPTKIPDKAEPFNVLTYAKKGFNSDLMVDPSKYSTIKDVDFDQLCKAYVVKYPVGLENSPRSPVYIPLGYLLAFLNNMCLIYDSIDATLAPSTSTTFKDSPGHPYFYIDFNPNTNFCLTLPQQLSVDPYVCLIPFNADDTQYTSIFPKDVTLTEKFNPSTDTKGNGENVVTAALEIEGVNFKPKQTTTQANRDYQGKTMNILINVQYLIGLVREYQGSDKEHAVRFQPFLERIMIDVNKSMGNINSFRIAYRDDSNVVQIQDDQWVPSLVSDKGETETSVLQAVSYNSKLKAGGDTKKLAGLLPLFSPDQPGQLEVGGSLGIAREFRINTIFSTRLASTIAISAQANTGSVNATDHSSLSWLNQNKQDRYKKYIRDASSDLSAAKDAAKQAGVDKSEADRRAAQMFNDHVKNVYYDFRVDKERVESAKNYYIERMSKVKSGDIITSSTPFIPVELNLTLDGISGIIMGNAFTIPEERLPLSLRGENGLTKIAFIVAGLHHTIENNEWITKIKGQVIKLRGQVDIPKASTTTTTLQYKLAQNNGSGIANSVGSDYQLSTYQGKVDRYRANGSKYTVCPNQYPGAGADYSCARQVKIAMTQAVFDKQYGYVFKKNVSDIKLPSGISPLTLGEIVDKTNENHFDQGTIPSPVANFVIHHTGGGTVDSNIGTFKQRGFPAQYLIDKDGKIYQFMPNGALAWHAGSYNSHSIGVEVIGDNDADIANRSKSNNNAQLIAAARLARYLGFSRSQIIGHGKVPGADKNANEGKTIVDYINTLV